MSHTPGPWAYGVTETEGDPNCDDGRGFRCYAISAPAGSVVRGLIAKTPARYAEFESGDEANARLIAAAPELLSALRYMVENAESEGWSGLMLSDAVAAIAKAEGKA
jgi:hypothetical protein